MDPQFLSIFNEIRIFTASVMELIHRDKEGRHSRAFPGRTGVQLGVLRILSSQSFTLSEIGVFMQLAPSTLLPVINRLEKEGPICREADAAGRHRNWLVLSDAGSELLIQISDLKIQNLLVTGLASMQPLEREELNHLPRGW